ncbi:MAG TPA: hypothetical protein VGQ09_00875 [Chitinophagaceae bacterium]|jgi:hypothetical protein|nr:hypothetical protein [Chitinophagaceae bacterium]
MKNTLLLLLLTLTLSTINAQLKVKAKCNTFYIDILGGKVNDVMPNFTRGQIKSKLPCFTGEEAESSKCGGVIYYKDRDIKFFTGREYVEIGPAFKDRLSLPLMGSKRGSLFKLLGNPKLKDDTWDAFQTQYGCLILYYNAASKVRMIRFSTKTTDEVNLCE